MLLDDIADRGAAYGIPGIAVDGMDVKAVYEVAGQAVERARKGQGPTLIECKTYRFRGHSRFEDPSYRTKEELQEWMKLDPIELFLRYLETDCHVDRDAIIAIEGDVRAEIEDAVKFAEASPDPQPRDYEKFIYA